MALNEANHLMTPLELTKALGTSSDVVVLVSSGAPDGNSAPESDAAAGSIYIRDDAGTDETCLYVKVDTADSDDDWAAVLIAGEIVSGGRTWATDLTIGTDKKFYFRDTGIYLYSSADGVLHAVADGSFRIGDGTNEAIFAADGEMTLAGTAKVTDSVGLPIATGGGTATIAAFKGAPSINLDADGETWYGSFEAPKKWNAASDMTIVCMVANEIAETDGDDVSFTGQVRGYADGETMSDAGQAVTFALNLTGGDEAIDVINRVTGTIDYNEATYPIAAGDTVVVKMTVNLTDGTECTGPLHIIKWWCEFTKSKLGTAT